MKKVLKKTAVFTTTISGYLLEWLNNEAKMQKTTKRQVLENALTFYKVESKRKAMAESFKRAAKDIEMIWMAEAGMADFQEMLDKYEQT